MYIYANNIFVEKNCLLLLLLLPPVSILTQKNEHKQKYYITKQMAPKKTSFKNHNILLHWLCFNNVYVYILHCFRNSLEFTFWIRHLVSPLPHLQTPSAFFSFTHLPSLLVLFLLQSSPPSAQIL